MSDKEKETRYAGHDNPDPRRPADRAGRLL